MGDTINGRLQKAFGAHVRSEAPLADSGAGIRISGVDLCKPLNLNRSTSFSMRWATIAS